LNSTKIATALALIATLSTSYMVSARPCYDENGNRVRCGVIGGSARVVEGAGEGALNILTLGGHERAKERERRENRTERCEHGRMKGNCQKCQEEQEEIENID